MPKHVVPELSMEWLNENYYRCGCNLKTAASKIGVSKGTFWAWLKANGHRTKPQSESQSGDLNGFYGHKHGQRSRAIIGLASSTRQARMLRGKFGRYGNDGKHCSGEHSPTWVSGIGSYRKLVDLTACSLCGSKNNIQVHHKDKNRKNNEKSNLVVLCAKCHIFIAHGKTRSIATGRFEKGGAR